VYRRVLVADVVELPAKADGRRSHVRAVQDVADEGSVYARGQRRQSQANPEIPVRQNPKRGIEATHRTNPLGPREYTGRPSRHDVMSKQEPQEPIARDYVLRTIYPKVGAEHDRPGQHPLCVLGTGGGNLSGELCWCPEVVVVDESDPGRARMFDSRISRLRHARPRTVANDVHAGVFESPQPRVRVVCRGVIDDDDLDVHRFLSEHRRECPRKQRPAIAGRYHDRYARLVHRPIVQPGVASVTGISAVSGRNGNTSARHMIHEAIQQLLDGRDLGRELAREVMGEIMRGEATPAQIGGFLIALRGKGETADEIAGCAEAMREHVLPVHTQRGDLVDTAGTGGDGAGTLNISTAAAIVAAAAGAAVAKHGNRAVSSASGSADVLEALGFRLDLTPEHIARSIDELGFGFMFAPLHHPAMRHAAPVRRELQTRTVFNVLGPLTNPAGARAQIVGVYSPGLVRTLAEVLARLGAERAFVVHGAYGIDELSPAGQNLVCEVVDGSVEERTVEPLDLGVERCAPEELRGGTPEENAEAIRAVFAGADGGRRNAILLNASGAIAAGGLAADLREGLELAREAIDSGAAAARLDELARFTNAV
jgi:anthranilate phosphoribosyltransferase